jgi:hypothetical protein
MNKYQAELLWAKISSNSEFWVLASAVTGSQVSEVDSVSFLSSWKNALNGENDTRVVTAPSGDELEFPGVEGNTMIDIEELPPEPPDLISWPVSVTHPWLRMPRNWSRWTEVRRSLYIAPQVTPEQFKEYERLGEMLSVPQAADDLGVKESRIYAFAAGSVGSLSFDRAGIFFIRLGIRLQVRRKSLDKLGELLSTYYNVQRPESHRNQKVMGQL